MTDIALPASLAVLHSYSFANCSSLASISFFGSAPTCGNGWIEGHNIDLIGYYIKGTAGWTDPWQGIRTMVLNPSVPEAATIQSAVRGNASVALTWSAPTDDGGRPLIAYAVLFGTSSPDSLFANVGAAQLSVDVTGLSPGVQYIFGVVAINEVGGSNMSNVVSALAATFPGPPLALSAFRGDSSVTLSWSAPANDGWAAIDYYDVYQDGSMLPGHVTALTLNVIGLANGRTYSFFIVAHNAIGNGTASGIANATPATRPGAPVLVSATVTGNVITVTWSRPADDGGSAITGYKVFYWNSTMQLVQFGGTWSASTTSVDVNGLAEDTRYSFAAKAVNDVNDSVLSNDIAATISRPGRNIAAATIDSAAAVGIGAGLGAAGMAAASQAAVSSSPLANFFSWLKELWTSFEDFFNFAYGLIKKRATYAVMRRARKHSRHQDEVVDRPSFVAGFSSRELVVMAFASIVLALTYLIARKMEVLSPGNLGMYIITAGFTIVLVDMAHRYMSWKYHARSEYKFWWLGSAIILLTSVLFGIVFAMPARLVIDKDANLSKRQEAVIFGAGPLVSFLAFLCFALLLPWNGLALGVGFLGCSMNLLAATYGMMPFEPMDGAKVFRWKRGMWALAFVPVIVLYFVLTILVF